METLSSRLQWILDAQERSARNLSMAAGLSPSYVGQLIRGDAQGNIGLDVAKRIAAAAGVDVTWLLTGEMAPPLAAELAVPPIRPHARPSPRLQSHVDTSEADTRGDADVVMDILRQLERERGKPIPGRMVQKILAANHLGGATYDSVKNLLLDLFLDDSGKVQDRAEPVKVDTGRGGMALGPATKKKR